MDIPAVSLLLAAAVALLGGLFRLVIDRFDTLQSKEREEFDVRFQVDQPINEPVLFADLLKRWDSESKGSSGLDEAAAEKERDRQRMRDLELRLAELEAEREASQRDFAVQREYHALGLAQSKLSFNLGYVFGAIGAVVILAGAIKVLFFTSGDNRATIAAFTAVAGAIPEGLAALLFVNAGRAGTRMSENFDRSRQDRDLVAAQQIAAEMEDRPLGNRLQAVLALSMAQSDVSPSALSLLGMGGTTDQTERNVEGTEDQNSA